MQFHSFLLNGKLRIGLTFALQSNFIDFVPIICSSHLFKRRQRQTSGPPLIIKTGFPGMGILMLKIRRSRLVFNMGIPLLVGRHLYIETATLYPVKFHNDGWHCLRLMPLLNK